MSNEPRMTGMDKEIFNATRTLTSLLNDACNHWNYLCPYLEKLAGVADDALRGYQKDYPEQVAELIDYRRTRDSQGDTAKLREACEKMLSLLMLRGDGCAYCILSWDEFNDSQKMLRAALSAPARNCDIYAETGECAKSCPYRESEGGCAFGWLLATAAERKGGDK